MNTIVLNKFIAELDIEILKNSVGIWEEEPVSPKEFFTTWLKPELSEAQLNVFESLFLVDGKIDWNKDWNEYILMWGEGSGKDFFCIRIIIYTAYFLMCLKNPQKYFNFADNEPIDLVNVSFSSTHAKDVFFKRLLTAVKLTMNPKTGRNWFEEKGMDLRDGQDVQVTKILFKKNITAYSLNSQRYTGEGKNILIAVFDEIAEFKPSKAKELYENLWFTAESRWGSKDDSPMRIILLSYLRNEFDYMNYRWNQSETEEKVYRSRKATWEVRPDKTREDYNRAFGKNPEDAARRYGNVLSDKLGNRFFKYPEKIVEHINKDRQTPYEDKLIHTANLNTLTFKPWFRPYLIQRLDNLKELTIRTKAEEAEVRVLEARHRDTQYFIHLDLAKGKEGGDCAGFAMVHPYFINPDDEDDGVGIYLDLVMQLKGDRGEIDFEEIRNFILGLEEVGYPIGAVTADSFGSIEMIQLLKKKNIKAKELSTVRTDEAFQTLKELIYSKRIDYYNYLVLIRELDELINVDRKIDHPEVSQRRSIEEGNDKGSKDCADAVAGASLNALSSIELEGDWLGVEL